MTSFQALIDLMATLRSPDGCAWDREQTLSSLVPYTLEESHELIASIESQDWLGLKEELGDLLFHIVFYARIAEESALFSIDDVAKAAVDKMQRRHPHIFSTGTEATLGWHEIKQQERQSKQTVEQAWDHGVPSTLPALLWAYKLQRRARDSGFEWKHSEPVWHKLEEEFEELRDAIARNDPADIADEFGDVLFTLVNLSPFLQVHPENALRQSCLKFRERLSVVYQQAESSQTDLSTLNEVELDQLWQAAKKALRRKDSADTTGT